MTMMPLMPRSHHEPWGLRLLRWTPRVLALLFVGVVAIFALDVLGVGYSPWETLVALFMHLVPNFVLLAVVALAWRWPWVGAIGFFAVSIPFLDSARYGDWLGFVILALLPILTGMFYFADWLVRKRVYG